MSNQAHEPTARPDLIGTYQVLPFPVSRLSIVDTGIIAARRHLTHGLLELDVTEARRILHERKARTGESPSFTGFLVHCLAQAIHDHPHVQAYLDWRGRLIVFDDVDVVTLIETETNKVALPHVIRAANRKTFDEISSEIRAVQNRPARSAQSRELRRWIRLPRPIRMIFYRYLMGRPRLLKRYMGTAVITSVGMFGQGGGWALGLLAFHTLGLTVGGIVERPAFVGGQVVPREFLCLSASFNHDVVDGAPAVRFLKRFKELIECAAGL